jgi:oligopeptide transport system substrate-binding protein
MGLKYNHISTLVVGLITVLALTSCGRGGKTPADAAADQKILLLGNGSEPKGIDPHLVTGVPENNVIISIIEGLLTYHPSDDSLIEPGVAEHWEANEDSSVWTFKLRENARWTNGDAVTAHDFVYAAERMLTASLGARYADMLYLINNAEEFHKAQIEDFELVGIRALNDHTLRYELIGPTPHFLSMINHYAWYPVHPPTIERFGGIANRNAEWTQVQNFVGNGPFVLTRWETNNLIEVVKNPNYWDAENVKLNGIRFFPIERQSTEAAAFDAEQIHYCYQLPLDRIPTYVQEQPEIIHFDDYFGTYFYRFNVTKPPLDNPLVRKALSLAIDRESIVKHITRGNERAAEAYVYSPIEGYNSSKLVAYDPVKAKALLAEAGYPNGEGFPKDLEILINTQEAHKVIAESIQQMWKTHLNIEMGLINQEWKVYLDSQYKLKYDISRSGWIGDFVDPSTFLMIFTSDSGNNQTGWGNDEFDELYNQVVRTGDAQERLRLMERMEAILLGEAVIAPIYWYTRKYLLHPRVKGWHPKLQDLRTYKYIDFKDS